MTCTIFRTDPWFLLTEKATHCDLLSYLKTAQAGHITLPESEMLHFITGILDGLQHLHKQRVGFSYIPVSEFSYFVISKFEM